MSTSREPNKQPSRHRLAPALGLFVLAPLVGEFLLGNLPITWLWTLLTLAPLYGGGALLIRETARKFGLGWPSMLLLGLAYAIVEEAFVTQSLFNDNYLGLRLLDYGYLPTLGIGAWWTVFVLALHTIWSTAVPIALVESMATYSRRSPWLGRTSVTLTAIVFLMGCVATAQFQPATEDRASIPQLVSSGIIVATLVIIAVMTGRRRPEQSASRRLSSNHAQPLSPALPGGVALAGGSAFMGLAMVHSSIPAAANVSAMLIVMGVISVAVLRWSRRHDWSEQHRVAVAGGFLLTYVWYSFVQEPSVGDTTRTVDLIGNVALGAAAIALLAVAFVRAGRGDQTPASASN